MLIARVGREFAMVATCIHNFALGIAAMKWTRGVVIRKRIWSQGLFTLQIEAPGVEEFEAGQFLQLGYANSEGKMYRPYSVASPHGGLLDFFVVLVDEGEVTPHLWGVEEGHELSVSVKAAGSFTLSKCPDANTLWLLATGTGLAPYIAMLRTAAPWNRYENIVVVHGVRHLCDLAYQDEFAEHAQTHGPRFSYVPVVSRESGEGTLPDRITTCIENGALETRVGQAFSLDCCVMMCGNPAMLNDAEELLAKRGLKKHKRKEPGQVVIERYW